MNALLLFNQASIDKKQADPVQLTKLLNEADPTGQYDYAVFENLTFYISNEKTEVIDTVTGKDLAGYDAVYFRYWGETQAFAIACARYLDTKGVPFVDEEVLRKGSYNKLNQYMNLWAAGVRIPNTLVAPNSVLLKHYAEYFSGFPVLIKAVSGTRGSDNYVVHSEEELTQKLQENPDLIFTMQNLIPNDGDYRVIVMGDTIPLVIHRRAVSGSHLNNTSQGGAAEVVDPESLPEAVRQQAIAACKYFGRTIGGADVMHSTEDDQFYFLEINRSPQIDHSSFEPEKAQALTAYLRSIAKS